MPLKRQVSALSVFLNKTDGRDALIKIIQFSALLVAFFAYEFGYKDLAIRAGVLMAVSRDTRRLMRMFKGIIQYNRLMELSGFVGQSFYHNSMILTRIFFILWMFFDNLAFLSDIRTLESEPAPLNKLACIFWTAELISEQISRASQLFMDYKSRAAHLLRFPSLKQDSAIAHSLLKQRKLLSLVYQSVWKIFAINLNLIAALSCTTLLSQVFNLEINNAVIGFTSLAAAMIEGYQVYTGALTDNLT